MEVERDNSLKYPEKENQIPNFQMKQQFQDPLLPEYSSSKLGSTIPIKQPELETNYYQQQLPFQQKLQSAELFQMSEAPNRHYKNQIELDTKEVLSRKPYQEVEKYAYDEPQLPEMDRYNMHQQSNAERLMNIEQQVRYQPCGQSNIQQQSYAPSQRPPEQHMLVVNDAINRQPQEQIETRGRQPFREDLDILVDTKHVHFPHIEQVDQFNQLVEANDDYSSCDEPLLRAHNVRFKRKKGNQFMDQRLTTSQRYTHPYDYYNKSAPEWMIPYNQKYVPGLPHPFLLRGESAEAYEVRGRGKNIPLQEGKEFTEWVQKEGVKEMAGVVNRQRDKTWGTRQNETEPLGIKWYGEDEDSEGDEDFVKHATRGNQWAQGGNDDVFNMDAKDLLKLQFIPFN